MKLLPFVKADILIPPESALPLWSVVACDQYTSQPEYWDSVEALVGGAPSSFHMILPEHELERADVSRRIENINRAMENTLSTGFFREYLGSMVLVERRLSCGKRRLGLVGAVDLECYDYSPGSSSPVRATEGTVLSRIPPRVAIRKNAALELPHILLLIDDPEDTVFSGLERGDLELLYDFELMKSGGHIAGRRIGGEKAAEISERIGGLLKREGGICVAVGDGNHSLATAKAVYEELKKTAGAGAAMASPARYALAELCNIHSEAMEFEPIHRVLTGVDAGALEAFFAGKGGGEHGVLLVTSEGERALQIPEYGSSLAVGSLQNLLDEFLAENPGEVDYVHGDSVASALGRAENAAAFLLPFFEASSLFPTVEADGALPRKTFSMGHAHDKRFYLECRKIR